MKPVVNWTVLILVLWGWLGCGTCLAAEPVRPNVVIFFADDLGYGDLGCYGHPTISTPNLDRMAAEGQRWTQFYVAASMCTPSRAGLLTGRLPIRSGMCSLKRHVLYPNSAGGLPADEITLAEALKDAGYTTGMVGKWHLGHLPKYLPTTQGFDSFFGLPYSNDMRPTTLMRGTEVIENPADQNTLTKRYTKEAIQFIEKNRDKPFFLYFAHTFPHTPLHRSEKFADRSRRGLFGDVVEELDDSVGQVLDTLRRLGLDKRTLVVFTSDNGPWLPRKLDGGSAGLLRGGKGSTWEGGMREPGIFWWPGTIQPKVVRDLGCSMDLFTTCIKLCGAKLPDDRPIDGLDLSPVLLKGEPSPRDTMFYYRGDLLCAVRHGPYKMYLRTQNEHNYGDRRGTPHDPPWLFHVEHDPSERFHLEKKHPEVIKKLSAIIAEHRKNLVPAKTQMEAQIPKPKKKAP